MTPPYYHHQPKVSSDSYDIDTIDTIDINDIKPYNNTPSSSSSSLLSKIKRRLNLRAMREKWATSWAPLMAAKSHLDSEYNFPKGRYAGQGYYRR